MKIHTIDLKFQLEGTIAAYLVETDAQPFLVETGPHSTYPRLKAGIEALGYKVSDLKAVFLTHIHFDHAGAAWALAKEGVNIYVHPVGAPHLLDPSRLYNSAKRIYGDQMETLWGKMEPIAEEFLNEAFDNYSFYHGGVSFRARHSPGHANHHIAWQVDDIMFTGDVAGCKIGNGPVVPPCPPPDIDIEVWKNSIDSLLDHQPQKFYLTHFGHITDVRAHMKELKLILDDWANWMKVKFDKGMSNEEVTPLFKEYAANQLRDAGLSEKEISQYEAANPAWMSVAGLMRYWKKKGG